MGSMGAALAAAGASGAAGATSMAGMSSTTGASAPFITALLTAVGLDFLDHIPDPVLRPIFIALLLASAGSAYLVYRTARHGGPFALTVAAALALYAGIYLWMSEAVYYLALLGMFAGAAWGLLAARRAAPGSAQS